MSQLINLVPNPSTDMQWVPRSAAISATAFAGFNTPGFISSVKVIGNLAYGTIASNRNPGNDEPFVYNIATNTFLVVGGITAANTPLSPATTGDWVPPIIDVIGSRIVMTHPGFAGAATGFFFGWFDISGFTSNTITGDTHGTTAVDTLSTDVLTAGWNVGMTITDLAGDLPAGTYIKAIAANGLSLTLSAAATGSHATTFTVAGGTATAPLWGAGNVNQNPLLAVPVSVVQFNGRAYFAVGNSIPFSDSGNATQATDSSVTQVLTPNNGIPVTSLAPLPLLSPVTGGIIQAIVAFQSTAAIQLISGDPTTSNLLMNLLKGGTGTLAPLSLMPTIQGLGFISPEGLRFVSLQGMVSEPIGDAGKGVAVPFINVVNPSRTCAVYNTDTLRISVQNGAVNGQPVQDYWFDFTRKVWFGPHTFPASIIQPYNDTFIMVANGINAQLWQSDATPSIASVYIENGKNMSWDFQTSLLPDTDDMAMHEILETTVGANWPPQAVIVAAFLDEFSSVIDSVNLAGSGAAATIWGAFTWGAAPWLGGVGVFKQRSIFWHIPIVVKQGSIQLSGNSVAGLIVGNLYIRYQELGYVLENTS